MKNDDTAVQGGAPGERREPSLPKHAAPLRYVQTPHSRREPQLSGFRQEPSMPVMTDLPVPPRPAVTPVPPASPPPAVAPAPPPAPAPAAAPPLQQTSAPAVTTTGTLTAPAGSMNNPTGNAPGLPPIPELERMKGIGDTLNGRFVLEECIGFGGMGMVYKALDLRKLEASDRKPYIAIKVLNVQFRGHPKSLIALQREARKAQALAHPNIVAVYDFDRDGSMVYLTMEYLVGEPLSKRLRAPDFSGMPLAQAMPIISGMAKALAYAHQRGFVHCDLKPANVFLTERGDVKVIDFGIARVFQKTEEDQDATVFDAGTLGGLTPAYASPEMLEHRVPDPRNDIYALACITCELLTGRHPFDRLSAIQARGAGMKPPRPSHLNRRQWRALRAALSFERETRMPSVMHFLEELGTRRRVPMFAAVATTGGVAAVLGAAFLLYRGGNSTGNGDHITPGVPYGVQEDGNARRSAQGAGGMLPNPRPDRNAGMQRAPVPFERPPMGSPPQIALPQAGQDGNGLSQPPRSPPIALTSVTPVISRISCSALSASVSDHALDIRGFLSEKYGAARLKAQLAKLPGVESMNLDVRLIPETACATINLLAPYWQKSRQSGAGVRTRAENGQMTEGEPLVVDVTTPNRDTWVYVDYFVLDGGVAHLLPSVRARDNQAPPSYSATIGSFGNWIIARPFGAELIVLMTTPAPLFDGLRPEYETAPDYLRALKKQLRQIASKYGPDKIAVDFVQINTRAKTP